MRRAAEEFDLVLVAFTEHAAPPPAEVLAICAEVVLVRRAGSHSLPFTGRPEVVEEFASLSFRAALQQTVRKWSPAIAQLEFTQLAQYAPDCAPARTILVEHDVTFDLYQQLLRLDDRWELRRELDLWRKFETAAWRTVDRVVTMSEKDRRMVTSTPAVTLANGVDLERFRPGASAPDPRRILFIGSFAHRPNVLAMEFFVHAGLAAAARRDAPHHRRRASRAVRRRRRSRAARHRTRRFRRRRPSRLPARHSRGRAAGGIGRHQHQDPGGDGDGQGGGQHTRRGQRPGSRTRRGFRSGADRPGNGGRHRKAAGRPRRPCPHRSCRPRPCGTRLQLGHDRPRPVGPVPRTAWS